MAADSFSTTYCTNVHPGETTADLHRILSVDVAAVKDLIRPDAAMGLGLRMGNSMVRALKADRASLGLVMDLCDSHAYDVFTVNGFPYGDFSDGVIKSEVYRPSWLHEERVTYTRELAELLVKLPGPSERTISTVAGGFADEIRSVEAKALVAKNLMRCAQDLANLYQDTGVQVRLCLEPEPWTMLETTDDAVSFFERYLTRDQDLVQTHLGLCYDCCHQAIHFEDPYESVRKLLDAGIVIGKVQVSSALHLDDPQNVSHRAALLAFDEPRFLHQVVARSQGDIIRCLDLGTLATPPAEFLNAEAWRCHFHVPIWWDGDGVLGTTKDAWQSTIRAIKGAAIYPHLEIETYTWHVLPESERSRFSRGNLSHSIAQEFNALEAVLSEVHVS